MTNTRNLEQIQDEHRATQRERRKLLVEAAALDTNFRYYGEKIVIMRYSRNQYKKNSPPYNHFNNKISKLKDSYNFCHFQVIESKKRLEKNADELSQFIEKCKEQLRCSSTGIKPPQHEDKQNTTSKSNEFFQAQQELGKKFVRLTSDFNQCGHDFRLMLDTQVSIKQLQSQVLLYHGKLEAIESLEEEIKALQAKSLSLKDTEASVSSLPTGLPASENQSTNSLSTNNNALNKAHVITLKDLPPLPFFTKRSSSLISNSITKQPRKSPNSPLKKR